MPKTYMGKTEAQRIEACYNKRLECIGNNLFTTMNREKLNRGQMSKRLGISPNTLNRVFDGESVKLDTITFIKMLDFARIHLREDRDELEAQ